LRTQGATTAPARCSSRRASRAHAAGAPRAPGAPGGHLCDAKASAGGTVDRRAASRQARGARDRPSSGEEKSEPCSAVRENCCRMGGKSLKGTAGKTILVVDDDRDIREAMADAL